MAEQCFLWVPKVFQRTAPFPLENLDLTPQVTQIIATGGVVSMKTVDREKRGGSAAGQNSAKVFKLGPKAAETFFLRIPEIFCWAATSIAMSL